MENASLGALIGRTITSGRRLAEAQIAITKAEVSAAGQDVAKVSVAALIALSAISVAGLFLLIAAAMGLVAAGLAPWLAFLIVALVLLLGAVIAALIARAQALKIRGPKVAVEEWEKTQQALSSTFESS